MSPLDSKLDCFKAFGDQTAQHLRERFQLGLTQQAVNDHLERLIVNSIGSRWTQLYDSVRDHSVYLFPLHLLIRSLSPLSFNGTLRVSLCDLSFASFLLHYYPRPTVRFVSYIFSLLLCIFTYIALCYLPMPITIPLFDPPDRHEQWASVLRPV